MYDFLSKVAKTPFLFGASRKEQENAKFELVKESFKYHYENNEYYNKLCKASNIRSEDLNDCNDLFKIPLIPMKTFKLPDPGAQFLLSRPISEMEMELTSSGTGGIYSCARRDSATVTNLMTLIMLQYREFIGASNGATIFLAPSPGEVPKMANLGMIRTFMLFKSSVNTCEYAVENGFFDCEKVMNFLNKWKGSFTRYIFGPPFLLNSLCDYLIDNDIKIKLDEKSNIVTIGGWKHNTGAQIPRNDLEKKCIDYLGVKKHQIRDMYAMAECNFIILECEKRIKHIPPTMHFSIRSFENPKREVDDGEKGLIAVIDPSCMSYPAYVLTEDIGIIKRNVRCSCGRSSDVIEILGRNTTPYIKTCALTLEDFIEEKTKQYKLK